MLWVLDDGPLKALCKVARSAIPGWPAETIACAESTWIALEGPENLATSPIIVSGSIKKLSISDDSPEWRFLFDHLRPNTTNQANMAEHECIAWLAHAKQDAQFVTMDKGAFDLASGELGPGRVLHVCDCWDSLKSSGFIDHSQFSELLKLTYKGQGSVIPNRFRVP